MLAVRPKHEHAADSIGDRLADAIGVAWHALR